MPKVTGKTSGNGDGAGKGSNDPRRPRLTNRGGAGLYGKLTEEDKGRLVKDKETNEARLVRATAKHRIAPGLQHLAVKVADLVPDPNNARLHPERNLEAIKHSLTVYGQVKPLVVRKGGNVVVAGNGTLEAAKLLGWDELAVVHVEMNDAEAAGYGLADNRTAELAKWNFEVVAQLDRLLQEDGHPTIGWTMDELEVLRAADWTPPPVDDETDFGEGKDGKPLLLSLTPDQRELLDKATMLLAARDGDISVDDGQALETICREWVEAQEG
jgi:hypothetical protein